MSKNLVAICRIFNENQFCIENEKDLRKMTNCRVNQVVHNGVQLTLHLEITMLKEEKGKIFQLQTIPIFHESNKKAYQLNLEGTGPY